MRPRAVEEGKEVVVRRALEELEILAMLVFRLAREAADDVAGEGDVLRQRGDALLVLGDGVLAPHPLEHGIRAVLHRKMEMRHELDHFGKAANEVRRQVHRMRGGKPDPHDPRDRRDAPDEVREAAATRVRVHVLADEGHLADAHNHERCDLAHDLRIRA